MVPAEIYREELTTSVFRVILRFNYLFNDKSYMVSRFFLQRTVIYKLQQRL